MTGPMVLIVDDEPAIRRLLRTGLAAEGWRTQEAGTAGEALRAIAREAPDIVILDLGLPDRDGLEVVRDVRSRSTLPIVVLSVREAERSKVAALDLGADDYVTKPFGMEELMARLRAALRHRVQAEGGPPLFRHGDLEVDLVRRIVRVGGTAAKLSPREWDILALLTSHAGRVLTHRFILGRLWGDSGDPQQLRVYIRQIRQKIEAEPDRPRHLLTEIGVGYRLVADDPAA